MIIKRQTGLPRASQLRFGTRGTSRTACLLDSLGDEPALETSSHPLTRICAATVDPAEVPMMRSRIFDLWVQLDCAVADTADQPVDDLRLAGGLPSDVPSRSTGVDGQVLWRYQFVALRREHHPPPPWPSRPG